jgi:hypothetical protein
MAECGEIKQRQNGCYNCRWGNKSPLPRISVPLRCWICEQDSNWEDVEG